MLRFALPMLVLVAGCAATPEQIAQENARTERDEAKLNRALAGRTAGRPVGCITTRGLNVDIYGDKLLYRNGAGGSPAYLNQTTGGCFGFRRDDILVSTTPTGQFCRGDIIRTVDRTSGFPSGSCAFGDFVPYTRAPRG